MVFTDRISGASKYLSDKFNVDKEIAIGEGTGYGFWIHVDNSIKYQAYFKVLGCSSVEEFKTWLSSNNVKVLYQIEPQVIELTDEEVQTFKGLYTYSPTTVVSCSSDQLTPYVEFSLS